MGTEVLRPQDVFERFITPSTSSFQHRRNFLANGNLTNLIINRNPNNPCYNKKISPKFDKKKSPVANKSRDVAEPRRNNDVTKPGKRTLLRRGESLDSFTSKIYIRNPKTVTSKEKPADDLAICGMVPKQTRLRPINVYAGSAFCTAPSPRSVPLPTFFSNKKQFDDSATNDLRRMLNLE